MPTGPKAPRLTAFELSVDVEIKKLDIFFITSVSNTGCKSILCFAAKINLFKLSSKFIIDLFKVKAEQSSIVNSLLKVVNDLNL